MYRINVETIEPRDGQHGFHIHRTVFSQVVEDLDLSKLTRMLNKTKRESDADNSGLAGERPSEP